VAFAAYLTWRLDGGDRSVFLPGTTSDGHYQIELACVACHGDSFTSADDMQSRCETCHAEALDEARDAHPQSKFTDPRNAERVAVLDARYCVTCHVEHRPEATAAMGVTQPGDFCALCHEEIGTERPTHAGLGYDTCASSGCHNFHDNRALYEDFLLRHLREPALLANTELPSRNFASIARYVAAYPLDRFPLRPLTAAQHDAPAGIEVEAHVLAEWSATAHVANGVNCTACHVAAAVAAEGEDAPAAWIDRPDHTHCTACHAGEVAGFLEGRHGMRLNAAANGMELPPFQPGTARLPMKAAVRTLELGCGSCHAAHRFDAAAAAVEACSGCHDDEHTLAYRDSPHGQLWQRTQSGELDPSRAVTCATCHMPRTSESYNFGEYVHVLVRHNQSDNLMPNDKMLRPVCTECHGLGFSIDALADRQLIRRNFDGPPTVHVESLELAESRRRAIELERQRDARPSPVPSDSPTTEGN
jgi:hypothetical protein